MDHQMEWQSPFHPSPALLFIFLTIPDKRYYNNAPEKYSFKKEIPPFKIV